MESNQDPRHYIPLFFILLFTFSPFCSFFSLLAFVQGLYAVVGYTMRSGRSLPSAVARQAGAPDKGCTALLRGP